MLREETKLKEYSRYEQIEFQNMKTELSFEKPAFFCIHHLKEFRETIYFSRNTKKTSHTCSESTDQQHLHVQFKANLSKVQFKFLGDKNGFFILNQYFCINSIF